MEVKLDYSIGLLSAISSPLGIIITVAVVGVIVFLIIRGVKKRRLPEPIHFYDECGSPPLSAGVT